MSCLFWSADQIIEASSSALVLPMNIQSQFPLGLTSLIPLLSKELSRAFSGTTVWKHQFFSTRPSLWSSSHIHTWLLEKPELWLYRTLSEKWHLSFLIRCLGFSWFFFQGAFNFMAKVSVHRDFGAQEKKNLSLFPLFPHLFAMKWWDLAPWS